MNNEFVLKMNNTEINDLSGWQLDLIKNSLSINAGLKSNLSKLVDLNVVEQPIEIYNKENVLQFKFNITKIDFFGLRPENSKIEIVLTVVGKFIQV